MNKKQVICQLVFNVTVLAMVLAVIVEAVMAWKAAQLGVQPEVRKEAPPPPTEEEKKFAREFAEGLTQPFRDLANGIGEAGGRAMADQVGPIVGEAAQAAGEGAAAGVKAIPGAMQEGAKELEAAEEEAAEFEKAKEEGKRSQGRQPR